VSDQRPEILFADEHVVVVDKPAGMPSVPARSALDPPDVARVLAGAWGPLEAVHRLDRDTSGLLVLARSAPARAALGRAFEERRVDKRYLAVVQGRPPAAEGTVWLPLAPDPLAPPRQRVDPVLGRPAGTRWRLLQVAADAASSLLVLAPLTGRSHQLRTHLAWLGCPIRGDRLYGAVRPPADHVLGLHATAIACDHPLGAGRLTLVRPPPSRSPWTGFHQPAAWVELAGFGAGAAWPHFDDQGPEPVGCRIAGHEPAGKTG